MKKRTSSKLYPAIIMLLISTILVGSSTYAWFTMSREVQATGMELTAIAPTNLLISPDASDGSWDEVITIDEAYNGKLIPASSLDGVVMFATDSTKYKYNGAPDDTTEFTTVDTAIATRAGMIGTDAVTAKNGYYADYDLYIKTTGTEDVKVALSAKLTGIASTPNDDLQPAFRMAILTDDGTVIPAADGNLGTTYNTTGLPSRYNVGGGTYFGAQTPAVGTATVALTGPIVEAAPAPNYAGATATSTLAAAGSKIYVGASAANDTASYIVADIEDDDGEGPNTATAGTALFTVPGNTTADGTNNYHLIVRVWIEGQDSACINANANGDTAALTVGFVAVD